MNEKLRIERMTRLINTVLESNGFEQIVVFLLRVRCPVHPYGEVVGGLLLDSQGGVVKLSPPAIVLGVVLDNETGTGATVSLCTFMVPSDTYRGPLQIPTHVLPGGKGDRLEICGRPRTGSNHVECGGNPLRHIVGYAHEFFFLTSRSDAHSNVFKHTLLNSVHIVHNILLCVLHFIDLGRPPQEFPNFPHF